MKLKVFRHNQYTSTCHYVASQFNVVLVDLFTLSKRENIVETAQNKKNR